MTVPNLGEYRMKHRIYSKPTAIRASRLEPGDRIITGDKGWFTIAQVFIGSNVTVVYKERRNDRVTMPLHSIVPVKRPLPQEETSGDQRGSVLDFRSHQID